MSNVSKYETVTPNPKTGKVNPLHVAWADSRKVAIDGVRAVQIGATKAVADGAFTPKEADAAVAFVTAKVLTEAGAKVAKDAAATGSYPELSEALKLYDGLMGIKAAKKEAKAEKTASSTPDIAEAQAEASA